MKEELQSKLIEILTSIQNAAGKAGDFAMSQLPDIAQQYVLYGRVASALSVILFVAATVAGIWIIRAAIKAEAAGKLAYRAAEDANQAEIDAEPDMLKKIHLKKYISRYDYETDCTGQKMCGAGLALFGACCAIVQMQYALLVWFAPKVWLIKELASLVK